MEYREYDFIIIGAGPAGLSAAQYASRAGLKVLVLDMSMPGGQVNQIFKIENYPGVYPCVDGFTLSNTMKKQAVDFGAEFVQAVITVADKVDGNYVVKTSKVEYTSPAVLLATGAKHSKIGVKGEKEFEGRGVSYCATCDGPFFRNKKILVVGGGDSACSEACYLSTIADTVYMVHRRSQFRAQKAVADEVLKNPKIKVIFNASVTEIKGDVKVKAVELTDSVTQQKQNIDVDAVFVCVGLQPQTPFFDALRKDDKGYIITNEDMETGIPGLYAAGDVRSKSFRQVVTAVSDGAIAANNAAAFVRKIRKEDYR